MAAFESTTAAGALTSVGLLKLLTLGAAGLGALLMAVFRPPATRKEMFYQGLVALGSSLLFGNFFVVTLGHFIPVAIDPIAVHGLVGALSWGVFGGLAHLRDKTGSKSLDETFKDVTKN